MTKETEVIAIYTNYPTQLLITKIDPDADTIDDLPVAYYYHKGKKYKVTVIEGMDGSGSGFVAFTGDWIPFSECVRTGTPWGLPKGTTIEQIQRDGERVGNAIVMDDEYETWG